MKRIIFKLAYVLSIIVFLSETVSAQTFTAGENYFHIGIGFGNSPYVVAPDISGGYGFTNSYFPPISIVFEHAVDNHFSIGGMIAYSNYQESCSTQEFFGYDPYGYPIINSYTNSAQWSYTVIAARFSYHYRARVPKVDPYIGIELGYIDVSSSTSIQDPYISAPSENSGVYFGLHLGANYYFNPNVGVFGELGWGLAYLTIGLHMKM